MPIRELSDAELDGLKVLSSEAVEVALLHVTQTCLDKSIIDATGPVRAYLLAKGIHDFSKQGRGSKEHGIKLKATYVAGGAEVGVTVSLYKPRAKPSQGGDPRLCIYGLKKLASAGDILALAQDGGRLVVINLSKVDLWAEWNAALETPLVKVVQRLGARSASVANELLDKLKKLAGGGPVPSVMEGKADTAIGRTLEHYLGIQMNSSKEPDYKGIEIKAARIGRRKNRPQLFCRVPKWKISKFKSSAEILLNFGYGTGTDRRLNCTVRATGSNPQGLSLEVEADGSFLYERSEKKPVGRFATWEISELQAALAKKHKETFWVSATAVMLNGTEHFNFKHVVHTRAPLVNEFASLVDVGAITMDHLIEIKEGKVREGGPSFKIRPGSFDVIFPPNKKYSLS